jgi:hypothetical protein
LHQSGDMYTINGETSHWKAKHRMDDKELLIYRRQSFCSAVWRVERDLKNWSVPFREVIVDHNEAAMAGLRQWTGGNLSSPTVVVSLRGENMPLELPEPVAPRTPVRGRDMGAVIVEPTTEQLREFLRKHGFVADA